MDNETTSSNIVYDSVPTIEKIKAAVALLKKQCTMCKRYNYEHEVIDHPFFYSNLEYLEWECQKIS